MQAPGLAAFEARKAERSNIYAYENEPVQLSAEFEERFRANELAWAFFSTQAPSYQRTIRHWIMRAKRQETKLARLEKVIAQSSLAKRLL
jgi:uncharacterized protein YdeI (YjbR/CyaY-like superfamily)